MPHLTLYGDGRWEAGAADQPRDGGEAAEQRVAVALEACCDEVGDLGEKLAGDDIRRAAFSHDYPEPGAEHRTRAYEHSIVGRMSLGELTARCF